MIKHFITTRIAFISWGKHWKGIYLHFFPKYCVRIYLWGIDWHLKNPLKFKGNHYVSEYFEAMGYQVTWDFNNRLGEKWWEIYADDEFVAQIDMGIPLNYVLEDLCEFHLGKDKGIDRPDKPEYKICGNGPLFEEMLNKIYDKQHLK